FFQAEDGIRDRTVTGVQTCALPIWLISGGWMEIHFQRWRNRMSKKITWLGPVVMVLAAAIIGCQSSNPPEQPQPEAAQATTGGRIGRASCREREGVSGGAGRRRKRE